jgi:hypothetical protein
MTDLIKKLWAKLKPKKKRPKKPRRLRDRTRPRRPRAKRPSKPKKRRTRDRPDDKKRPKSKKTLSAPVKMHEEGHTLRLTVRGKLTIASVEERVIDKARALIHILSGSPESSAEVTALHNIVNLAGRARNLADAKKDNADPEVVAAFKAVDDAITKYGRNYKRNKLDVPTKWTPEVERALRSHGAAAEADFQNNGLSMPQMVAVERAKYAEETGAPVEFSWRAQFPMHQGTQVDTMFKDAARGDPILIEAKVTISPRKLPGGAKVPDFYHRSPPKWWGDLTTRKGWGKHISDYAASYGREALGIFYTQIPYEAYIGKFPSQYQEARAEVRRPGG